MQFRVRIGLLAVFCSYVALAGPHASAQASVVSCDINKYSQDKSNLDYQKTLLAANLDARKPQSVIDGIRATIAALERNMAPNEAACLKAKADAEAKAAADAKAAAEARTAYTAKLNADAAFMRAEALKCDIDAYQSAKVGVQTQERLLAANLDARKPEAMIASLRESLAQAQAKFAPLEAVCYARSLWDTRENSAAAARSQTRTLQLTAGKARLDTSPALVQIEAPKCDTAALSQTKAALPTDRQQLALALSNVRPLSVVDPLRAKIDLGEDKLLVQELQCYAKDLKTAADAAAAKAEADRIAAAKKAEADRIAAAAKAEADRVAAIKAAEQAAIAKAKAEADAIASGAGVDGVANGNVANCLIKAVDGCIAAKVKIHNGRGGYVAADPTAGWGADKKLVSAANGTIFNVRVFGDRIAFMSADGPIQSVGYREEIARLRNPRNSGTPQGGAAEAEALLNCCGDTYVARYFGSNRWTLKRCGSPGTWNARCESALMSIGPRSTSMTWVNPDLAKWVVIMSPLPGDNNAIYFEAVP